jgi:outer membrane lipopolysaccharide assembly protein LptE/RlpB
MSKSIKLLAAFGLFAVLSACGHKQAEDEFVVIDPEPISYEPVHTGKYK